MTFEMYLKERELESEQKGRSEGIESVAINMIRAGLPFDQVQKFTQLTFDKISELAKKLNQSQSVSKN